MLKILKQMRTSSKETGELIMTVVGQVEGCPQVHKVTSVVVNNNLLGAKSECIEQLNQYFNIEETI